MLFLLLAACDRFVLCDVVIAPSQTTVRFSSAEVLSADPPDTLTFELPSGRRISCVYTEEGDFCEDRGGWLGWDDGELVAVLRDIAPEHLFVELSQDEAVQATWEIFPDYVEDYPNGDRCPAQYIGAAEVDLSGG